MEENCRIRILSLCVFMIFISLTQAHQRNKRQIIFPDDNPNRPRSACSTPDRRDGNCIRITECQVLLRVNNFNRLRQFFCGYEGEEPRVCCPLGSENDSNTIRTTRRPTGIRRTTPSATRPTRGPTRPTRGPTRPTRGPTRPTRGTATTPRPRPRQSFLPRDCGISNSTKTRVVGGREAEKGAYPWMALILKEQRRGVKAPDCGGALVTNVHVVTAAHCVVERGGAEVDPEKLSVRLGDHNIFRDDDDMDPVEVPVLSIRMHEDFEERTYKNDIAVLTLARPVTFTKNISPICLPYDAFRDEDLTDRSGFVSGWGTTAFMGPSSNVLMEVSFPIVDQEVCRRIFANDLRITEEYLCAGTMDGTKDSCQGDSGGPLMLPGRGSRFYLVGIVSFGKQCAKVGYPGVYTRITKYLDWLADALS